MQVLQKDMAMHLYNKGSGIREVENNKGKICIWCAFVGLLSVCGVFYILGWGVVHLLGGLEIVCWVGELISVRLEDLGGGFGR